VGLMRFSVVTAFPDFIEAYFKTSIIGKAVQKGLLEYDVVNPRSFAEPPHNQIDDYAYGGGGMVLKAEPLARAVDSVKSPDAKVICLSPQGRLLNQALVESLAEERHLILVCGHYEGIDERFVQLYADMELSVGDYVLTGGELPALIVVDAVSRRIEGVVGKSSAVEDDSFAKGLLDHPHYTRPSVWRGMEVPKVLLNGDHGAVARWRLRESVTRTLSRRPDIIKGAFLTPYLEKGLYVILGDASKVFGEDEGLTEEVAIKFLKDVILVAQRAGCRKVILILKQASERYRAKYLLSKLKDLEPGLGNCDEMIKMIPDMTKAFGWIREKEKEKPYVVALSSESKENEVDWDELKIKILDVCRPVVLCFQCPVGRAANVCLKNPLGLDYGRDILSRVDSISVALEKIIGFGKKKFPLGGIDDGSENSTC